MGLAVLCLTNLLRVAEAWRISSPAHGKVCFVVEKLRRGDNEQDLGPWPSQWMRFIKEEQQTCGVAMAALMVSNRQQIWKKHGWDVTGTDLEYHKWHCLWRGGATQQWAAGARNHIIMLAGDSESLLVAEDARGRNTPCVSWNAGNNRTALFTDIGHQQCGGQLGCKGRSENWRLKPKQTAKSWEPLGQPAVRGGESDMQGRKCRSRSQPT